MRPTELVQKVSSILDASLINNVRIRGVVIYDKGYYKLSDGENAITLNTAGDLPVGAEIEVEGVFKPNLYSTKEYSAIYPAISVISYKVLSEGENSQRIQQELAKALREKEYFGFWEFFSRALEQKEVLIVGLIYGKSAQVGQDFKTAFRSSAGVYWEKVDFIELETSLSDDELAKAIKRAKQISADAVFLLRGGGSKEELSRIGGVSALWAVAQANLPFYTAIGHSYDRANSIMEQIADGTFATPSIAGAELGRLVRFFAELQTLKNATNTNVKPLPVNQKSLTTYLLILALLLFLGAIFIKLLNALLKH